MEASSSDRIPLNAFYLFLVQNFSEKISSAGNKPSLTQHLLLNQLQPFAFLTQAGQKRNALLAEGIPSLFTLLALFSDVRSSRPLFCILSFSTVYSISSSPEALSFNTAAVLRRVQILFLRCLDVSARAEKLPRQ